MTSKYSKGCLKSCPCCGGNAEWVEVATKEVKLWQISCANCGLATIPDDKKLHCIKHWNYRADEYKTSVRWALTLLFLSVFVVIAFCLGLATGAGIVR